MPDARAVADTGGVIGVWPNTADFPNLDAMAMGIKRMADVVGVAHVGLGTDMPGFIRPPVFTSYAQLPALAAALLKAGFTSVETAQILGGAITGACSRRRSVDRGPQGARHDALRARSPHFPVCPAVLRVSGRTRPRS